MTKLAILNRSDLYDEVAQRARERGVESQLDWNRLCDQAVDGYLGHMHPYEDVEGLRKGLRTAWIDYQADAISHGGLSGDDEEDDNEIVMQVREMVTSKAKSEEEKRQEEEKREEEKREEEQRRQQEEQRTEEEEDEDEE